MAYRIRNCGEADSSLKFAITCGLLGENGVMHRLDEATSLLSLYLSRCASQKKVFLSGRLFTGALLRTWQDEGGIIRSESNPCITYCGDVHPNSLHTISFDKINEALHDLADSFAEVLDQSKVHIQFNRISWELTRDDGSEVSSI